MIRRAFIPMMWYAAAWAQLPTPQAAPPRPDTSSRSGKPLKTEPDVLHVDAVVSDYQGRPARGLAAADFAIEADGKPLKIDACRYLEPHPVRIAILIDDLSLSVEHLAAVKYGLKKFVEGLPAGHEVAIVRTSGGEGAFEQFTADKSLLAAALEQVTYSQFQADSSANVFTVGTLGTLQAVLDGLGLVPGRKSVVLFSERLRDARALGAPRAVSLKPAANRGSAVVYAYDAAATREQAVALDEGIAALAEDTGGKVFESGVDPEQALARVLRDQAGYYSIAFNAEGLPYDYIERMPHINRLAVKARRDLIVRARKGAMGGTADPDDLPFRAPSSEMSSPLRSTFAGGGLRTRLTPLVGFEAPPRLDAVTHVDARDLAFTRESDGLYHAELQTTAKIFGNTSEGVQEETRNVHMKLIEATYREVLKRGFDYRLSLTAPAPGLYQLRVAIEDTHNARTGSASQLIRVPEWNPGKLTVSSIILREAGEHPTEPSSFRDERAPERIFAPGMRVAYTYNVHNLHRSQDKHAQFEVRSQLLREGVVIYNSNAQLVEMDVSGEVETGSAGGTIILSAQTLPGHYVMRLSVTDKVGPEPGRSATQFIDFLVR